MLKAEIDIEHLKTLNYVQMLSDNEMEIPQSLLDAKPVKETIIYRNLSEFLTSNQLKDKIR